MPDEPQTPPSPDPVTPDPPATPPREPDAPAPTVDLAAEASQAAATQRSNEASNQKLRSLDDLDIDGAVRAQIESYVSKSVNEAITRNEDRQKQKLDDGGYMNREQIEQLLTAKDEDHRRRESARDSFLSVLGSQGITPGSEKYAAVQQYYQKAIDDGAITPHILLSEAGIKTLVAMSGVSPVTSGAGPRSGLARSTPAPDGSVAFMDGTVQLNARTPGQGETLSDRVRLAVENSVNQQS